MTATAKWSPPAWGAWIETLRLTVDAKCVHSRPPRGGRGLKLRQGGRAARAAVAPRVGGVD